MVTIQDGVLSPLRFGTFNDPETGRPRVRTVNAESESYRVAREYMIRLAREDLETANKLEPIAKAAGMAPEAFVERYQYFVDQDTGSATCVL